MLDPEEAWNRAIGEETNSPTSREKASPRVAFLSLCEEGRIREVSPGFYCNSVFNKIYVLMALRLLEDEFETPEVPSKSKLWEKTMKSLDKSKSENGQLDVLLELWKEDLVFRKQEFEEEGLSGKSLSTDMLFQLIKEIDKVVLTEQFKEKLESAPQKIREKAKKKCERIKEKTKIYGFQAGNTVKWRGPEADFEWKHFIDSWRVLYVRVGRVVKFVDFRRTH